MFSQRAYLQSVSLRTGVPFWVLWGVEGMETDFGRNVTTSSAGAEGAFQFILSTANEWHYPYTNAQSQDIYERQAEAAGNYLASLKHGHASWEGALRAYSGGGYGEADVKRKALSGGAGITAAPAPASVSESPSAVSSTGGVLAPVAAVVGSSAGFLIMLVIAAGVGLWALAKREAGVAGVQI